MSTVVSSVEKEGENVGLHRFALFTACCTAFLIFVGGLVTSTESGLSVPDWPTTYGWNMIVTHDLEVAEQCSRTVSLRDGRIVEDHRR